MTKRSGCTRMGEVFFALCKAIDTPVSLGAWLRFQHNQLALAEMEISPGDYLDASTFELDYCVVSFLSKWKGLDTGLDLEAEALRKFTSSELSCGETNRRLRLSRKEGSEPFISAVIFSAKRKIARLLGPFSNFAIESKFGWGPGATDDIPRRRAFVDTKMCELPISVTPRALSLFKSVLSLDLHWSSVILGVKLEDLVGPFSWLDNVFNLTNECIIDTVPKNAKTHRVIAKEPRANAFLQKGFGGYLRSRLKRVGINLDDQTPNQRGALCAYEEGLATIDLKAASDSVAIELVHELLPVDWALALNDIRSPQARMPDGSTITLQKFSSMGNGFTFELESLIFWAIASSVMSQLNDRYRVLVYGDDIIVPADKAEALIAVLAFIGFQTNKDKTFIEGNFYESCGKHYFQKKEVTPVYQKKLITSEVETLRMGNRIMRLAYRLGHGHQLRKELYPAWSAARRIGRSTWRYQLPLGAEGDDGWLLPADDFVPIGQDLNLGLKCSVFKVHPRSFPGHEASLYAEVLRRGRQFDHSGYVDTSFFPLTRKSEDETFPNGHVSSSPETIAPDSKDEMLVKISPSSRWVMPSGEFGSSFDV